MRVFAVLLVLLASVAWAQDVEPPEWLFDDAEAEQEIETWGAVNQLEPLEIDEVKDASGEPRMVLLTKSLGGDPYFFPGGEWNNVNYEPFSGAEYPIIYMGVRVNAPGTWQVYYVTKEDGGWGEAQRQNFDIAAVDDFQDVQLEVTRGGWNERTVLRFRIDPGTVAGIESEIDYISLRGLPEGVQAVDAEKKLTVTWATLKQRR